MRLLPQLIQTRLYRQEPLFAALVTRRPLSQGCRKVQDIASLLQSSSSSQDGSAIGEVEVTGHVRTIRNQKRISFLELGDGSTSESLQALLKPEQAPG